MRLVREIQPRYFVLENVDGLLRPYAERIRISLERRIKYAGYKLVRPVTVLNAADYGVPQRRKRVFYIGYRSGESTPEYPYPLEYIDSRGKAYLPTVEDAIGDLPELEKYDYLFESDIYKGRLRSPSHYAKLLRCDIRDSDDRSTKREMNITGLTGCYRTGHSKKTAKRFENTPQGTAETISRYHRLKLDSISPTLRAGTNVDRGKHTAARPIHPLQARCITTREAARLHSYPDWFRFHETKWHAFRQIGNSVPPQLARAVGFQIMDSLHR